MVYSFKINDIRDARIDAVLDEMSNTTLCELPGDDPWTTEQFLTRTKVFITYTVVVLFLATFSSS